MTDSDRRLMTDKAGELLYRTLCDIRALTWSWEPGNEKRIEELADITHNLPRFMTGRDDHGWNGVREMFVGYARRYWPEADPERTQYVTIIDMDEETFDANFRKPSWSWPEPAATTAK